MGQLTGNCKSIRQVLPVGNKQDEPTCYDIVWESKVAQKDMQFELGREGPRGVR